MILRPAAPIRVAHVITGLSTGGAEMSLLRLLATTDRRRISPVVVALKDGELGSAMADLGVPVFALQASRGPLAAGAVARLAVLLRRERVDVVQSWMYHADLVGGLAARAARTRGVAWGIRQGDMNATTTRRSTRAIAHACARLSTLLPDSIVCCTAGAAEAHAALGYDRSRMLVIPNGLPVPVVPDSTRMQVRRALDIAPDALVVARIARWHPHKDYPLLMRAFRDVVAQQPRALLLGVGRGVTADEPEVARLLHEFDLDAHVRLLGERRDVTALLAASDIVVSNSNGEGFPNTVAEGMALGIPAVVTDVGESRELVRTTGWVVGPRDPQALAASLLTALSTERTELSRRGAAARDRIRGSYGTEAMADSYASLHERLAAIPQPRPIE